MRPSVGFAYPSVLCRMKTAIQCSPVTPVAFVSLGRDLVVGDRASGLKHPIRGL